MIKNFKDLVTHDSLCILPWHGFSLFPNGDVKNCAISKEVLGNIHDDDILSILKNEKNQQVKMDMINHVRHDRCDTCYRSESLQNAHHLQKISNRSWYMKVMGNHNLSAYSDKSFFSPEILDLRWRNTCNFSCIYCGPDLSSSWAKELRDYSNVVEESSFLKAKEKIFSNLDKVKHVYMAGGEPLLIKENLELLNLLKTINKDVTIRVNTNLSQIKNKIFESLVTDFKNVKWTVSIDSIEESFEYVRFPGNWENFVANLRVLQSSNQDISFNMTWSIVNAEEIFRAFEFLQKDMKFKDSTFIVQPVYSPDWLSINHLKNEKLEVLTRLINDYLKKSESFTFSNSLDSMKNFINLSYAKNIEDTRRNLDRLNQRRRIDLPHYMLKYFQ